MSFDLETYIESTKRWYVFDEYDSFEEAAKVLEKKRSVKGWGLWRITQDGEENWYSKEDEKHEKIRKELDSEEKLIRMIKAKGRKGGLRERAPGKSFLMSPEEFVWEECTYVKDTDKEIEKKIGIGQPWVFVVDHRRVENPIDLYDLYDKDDEIKRWREKSVMEYEHGTMKNLTVQTTNQEIYDMIFFMARDDVQIKLECRRRRSYKNLNAEPFRFVKEVFENSSDDFILTFLRNTLESRDEMAHELNRGR